MTELEDREKNMETAECVENLEFCDKSEDFSKIVTEVYEEINDESEDSEETEDDDENEKYDFGDIKQEKKIEEVFQMNFRLLTDRVGKSYEKGLQDLIKINQRDLFDFNGLPHSGIALNYHLRCDPSIIFLDTNIARLSSSPKSFKSY